MTFVGGKLTEQCSNLNYKRALTAGGKPPKFDGRLLWYTKNNKGVGEIRAGKKMGENAQGHMGKQRD